MTPPRTLKHIHDDLKKRYPDRRLLPGQGHAQATVVIVSDTPGIEEETEKKPLAGKRGRLLNQLLKSAGIDKRKVYVTNTVKYRAEPALAPASKEVRAHAAFLKEELHAINPRVVITLGDLALAGVGLRQPLHNVHGRSFNMGSYEVIPTFHPDLALRDEKIKDLINADFARVKDIIKTQKESGSQTATHPSAAR